MVVGVTFIPPATKMKLFLESSADSHKVKEAMVRQRHERVKVLLLLYY